MVTLSEPQGWQWHNPPADLVATESYSSTEWMSWWLVPMMVFLAIPQLHTNVAFTFIDTT